MAHQSSRDDPIILDDEEILHGVERLIEDREALRQRPRQEAPAIKEEQIDDDLEIKLEDKYESELGDFVDLTIEDQPPLHRRPQPASSRYPPRNAELDDHQYPVQTASHNGTTLMEDMMVEIPNLNLENLPNSLRRFAPEFFQIKHIIRDAITTKVTLRALPFTRTRKLKGILQPKKNEICLLLEIDKDDERPVDVQCLLEIKLQDHHQCLEREFWRTNRPFPEDRFPGLEMAAATPQLAKMVEEHGALVCRWRYSVCYQNATMRRACKANEWTLQHIRYEDAHPGHGLSDEICRFRWRNITRRGGSYDPSDHSAPAIEITEAAPISPIVLDDDSNGQDILSPLPARPGQRYTVGDVFVGAGGASRGIKRAGFHLNFGVDHWEPACNSYELNFPEVTLWKEDVHDFILNHADQYCLDVVHLSPPCQVWSPAHTRQGKNDEANAACLFSCTDLIKKLKPRIFTLEQTFGLLHPRFEIYRNALIQGFTCHGYSVSWKIVHLVSWGLPQTRKRLIMIGACHGEALPSFPEPTHGAGLQPFVTVRDVLNRIGPQMTLHNPDIMKPIDKPPYNADKPLSRTITCSGGQNYHPDGARDLTEREYASLNGFPTFHRFHQPSVKKQIGNAFPSCVVKVLYDHLLKHLEKEDNVQRELVATGSGAEVGVDPADDLIIVSESRGPVQHSPPAPKKEEDVKDVRIARTREWAGANALQPMLIVDEEPMAIDDPEEPIIVDDEEEPMIIDDDEALMVINDNNVQILVNEDEPMVIDDNSDSSVTIGHGDAEDDFVHVEADIGDDGNEDEEMADDDDDSVMLISASSPEPIPSPITPDDAVRFHDPLVMRSVSVAASVATEGRKSRAPIDPSVEVIDLTW